MNSSAMKTDWLPPLRASSVIETDETSENIYGDLGAPEPAGEGDAFKCNNLVIRCAAQVSGKYYKIYHRQNTCFV
jgi:hypothetical protein